MSSNVSKIKKLIMKRIAIFLCLLLIGFSSSMRAEITNDADFNNFITYYYQKPNPNEIINALKYYLKSDEFQNHVVTDMHVINILAYAFARLAENNPGILRGYEKVFDNVSENGQKFIITIFFYYRDSTNEVFLQGKLKEATIKHKEQIQRALSSPPFGRKGIVKDVENYDYLDYLWMEFFVTGDMDPITKIIDVLAWEDLFRGKLNIWMQEQHSSKEKKKLVNMLKDVGIIVDLETFEINLPSDLDCIFSAYLQSAGLRTERAKYGKKIKEILGFTDLEDLRAATKGSAMWALQSNSIQHPKVLEYIIDQIESRRDKAVIELRIIAMMAQKRK